MNTPSEDIKDLLVSITSLNLTFNTNLFIGRRTPTPNAAVFLFDTVGFAPQLTLGGHKEGATYERPGLQIQVRQPDYIAAEQQANAIQAAIHGRANEDLNGTLYTLIEAVDAPAFLEWDSNNRAVFVINFNLQRR